MNHTATYSPEDNKLRLYPAYRLDGEEYQKVKAAGFKWAPKQELFVAPMWTPAREDLLLEMCEEIGDEDTGLVDRAEERAERFDRYSLARAKDSDQAQKYVKSIADNIPLGQPILVGHHSEKHARKNAERIENGMRKAVRMWEQSKYWTDRAAGAIRAAKYKVRPDVRARRIKGLEADERKQKKNLERSQSFLKVWSRGMTYEQAVEISNMDHITPPEGYGWSLWEALAKKKCTVEQATEWAIEAHGKATEHCRRWLEHFENRLVYEREMYGESGSTPSDRVKPEKGGAVHCWVDRGTWIEIKQVNKVSVTVMDNWGNGGRDFRRTVPFDKLVAVMSKVDWDKMKAGDPGEAQATEKIEDPEDRNEQTAPAAETIVTEEMKATLISLEEREAIMSYREPSFDMPPETGIQVIAVPQLFPTPSSLAAKMIDTAGSAGGRVLEPSAGTGNLIRALMDKRCDFGQLRIVAVEINPHLVDHLRSMRDLTRDSGNENLIIMQADFLELDPADLGLFDLVVMNPPFERGADIKHIQHARKFLKPGGKLVALCANGPRQKGTQGLLGTWEDLPAGSFKSEGTNVNVALLTITN